MKPLASFAFFLLLAGLFSMAQAVDSLTICARSDGPPKHFIDSSGKVSGYAAEIAMAVASDAGFAVELKSNPWKRAQEEARKGNCIITGFSRTQQRQAEFLFTDALYIDRILLWQRIEDARSFDSYADLVGLKIGIAKGSRYSGEFEANRQNLSLVEALNSSKVLQLLQGGRIDAAIISGDRASVRYLSQRDGIAVSDLQPAERSVSLDPNHLGVPLSLKSADAEIVLDRLNRSVVSLKASGTLEQILGRYR